MNNISLIGYFCLFFTMNCNLIRKNPTDPVQSLISKNSIQKGKILVLNEETFRTSQ